MSEHNLPTLKVNYRTAVDLAVMMRRHQCGWTAFANSMAAEFGWSSTVGRILDRSAGEVLTVARSLCDLEFDAPDRMREVGEPTPIATWMVKYEHRRPQDRLLTPMPELSRMATGIYLDEQIEQLAAATEILEGRRGGRARARLREADTLKRRMRSLRGRL